MSAVAITGRCVVLPRRQGGKLETPAGFRPEVAYKILSGFWPNGSTDLHLLVLGEDGRIARLPTTDVRILDEERLFFSFPKPERVWHADTRRANAGWAETCLDLRGRKMLPHRVSWNESHERVSIEWSRPLAGHLLIG